MYFQKCDDDNNKFLAPEVQIFPKVLIVSGNVNFGDQRLIEE